MEQTQQQPNQDDNTDAQQDENTPVDVSGEQDAMASLAAAMEQASIDIGQDNDIGEKLIALEQENADLKDRMMRAAAEVENIRRRSEKEKQDTSKYAVTNFARDLISVYENLTRAVASITDEGRKESQTMANLAMGVEMTLKELETTFSKHHIQRIDPTGQPFDHNLHQAMTRIETAEHEPNTVVQVLQAAYVIHDRLLQPAMVAVAVAPTCDKGDTPQHVDTEA